jgi:FMN-binding domain.
MHKAIHIVLGTAAAATPLGNTIAAAAATPSTATATTRVIIVKKTVTGSEAQVSRWGYLMVTLVVRKTTTITGTKKKVARKIIGVKVPEYPNHTNRSVYINQQALPWLAQEVLQAQMNPNIQLISGATDTSYGFVESLQAALLKAKSV